MWIYDYMKISYIEYEVIYTRYMFWIKSAGNLMFFIDKDFIVFDWR